jgi:hypothetical protein
MAMPRQARKRVPAVSVILCSEASTGRGLREAMCIGTIGNITDAAICSKTAFGVNRETGKRIFYLLNRHGDENDSIAACFQSDIAEKKWEIADCRIVDVFTRDKDCGDFAMDMLRSLRSQGDASRLSGIKHGGK